MKKVLAGLVLICSSFLTTEAFAASDCLAGYEKITTGEVGIDGNEIYTCITSFPKQLNNICAPLFEFSGSLSAGFSCSLPKDRANKMCKDKKGQYKSGYAMSFKITDAEFRNFPNTMKQKYKKFLGKSNSVITYKCERV